MGRLFGTDGVRGIANVELTPTLAYKIGLAVTQVLANDKKHKPKIIIGKDTRLSSDMLEAALTAGICAMGGNVISCGVIPTPAIAYLTRKYGADAGVVISASHNPYEYNGIKVFNSEGFKLRDDLEDEVEKIVLGEVPSDEMKTYDRIGIATSSDTSVDDYVDFITAQGAEGLDKLKVVFDCANGATSVAIEKYIAKLGLNATVIHSQPDGVNINTDCGSTHIDSLIKEVLATKADLGIAFDGDGDRMLAVDENGELVDGDQLIAVFATMLKEEGRLRGNTAVVTTMSNLGFFEAMENNGIKTAITGVGDKYVLHEMIKYGYSVGGEQSGHIIFADINTTGDGLLSGLMLLNALAKTNKKMSELVAVMNKYPQVLLNVPVDNNFKKSYNDDEDINEMIERYSGILAHNGRILVRASGTEALIRVMIEGKDVDKITEMANDIADLIKEKNIK